MCAYVLKNEIKEACVFVLTMTSTKQTVLSAFMCGCIINVSWLPTKSYSPFCFRLNCLIMAFHRALYVALYTLGDYKWIAMYINTELSPQQAILS